MMNATPARWAWLLLAPMIHAFPAQAQASLSWSNGTIGSEVAFELTGGAAAQPFVIVPSFTAGPTPLALLFPNDPHELDVGLDLVPYWLSGLLNGEGSVDGLSIPIPNEPTLSGGVLYAQALTLSTTPDLAVDQITERVSFVLSLAGESFATLDDPGETRRDHTLTSLDDGRVLIAGGRHTFDPWTPYGSYELFDPEKQEFGASLGSIDGARSHHTATKLDGSGRVLLLGGYGPDESATSTGVSWDPGTGIATAIAPMSVPRAAHVAVALADGRVLVAGGSSAPFADPCPFETLCLQIFTDATSSVEIYDPALDAWTPAAPLPDPLIHAQGSRLADGSVLISGGIEVDSIIFGIPIPSLTDACHLYDPATGTRYDGPTLPEPRVLHTQLRTLDGGAMVVGGARVWGNPPNMLTGTTQTLLYDPFGALGWITDPLSDISSFAYRPTVVCVAAGPTTYYYRVPESQPCPPSNDEVESWTCNPTQPWAQAGGFLDPHGGDAYAPIDGGQRILRVGGGDPLVAPAAIQAEVYNTGLVVPAQ